MSATFIGFISLLKDFGYTSFIIQQPQISDEEIVAINTRVVLLGVAAFLAICLFVIPVSKFYNQVELLWILPITGSMFILNSFIVVPQALMRRNMQFDKIGKIDVSTKFVAIAVGVIFLFFIRSYWVLLLMSVFGVLFQIFITHKLSDWKFRFSNPYHSKISKAGVSFGKRLTIYNIMTFISVNLDNILIGKLAGNATLGNYNKAWDFGVTNVDRLVRRPLHQVYFSDLSGKDIEEKCRLFYQYLFLLLSLLLLVVGPFLICAEWIVATFLSSRWQLLTVILPPFLLCTFFWMSMSMADQLLLATSKLRRYLIIGAVKTGSGTLAIIIASFWGAEAIAWSFLIYHLLLYIPFCYAIFTGIDRELSKAREMMMDLCIIVFSAALITVIPFLLSHYGIIDFKVSLLFFVVLYVILLFGVWPKIHNYGSFKLFFKRLVALRPEKKQSY